MVSKARKEGKGTKKDKPLQAVAKGKKEEPEDDESASVYDSAADEESDDGGSSSDGYYDSEEGVDSNDDDDDDDEDEDGDFEDQGSSDDEDDILRNQIKDATAEDEDEDEDELEVIELESVPRNWKFPSTNRPTKRDESGRPIPNTTASENGPNNTDTDNNDPTSIDPRISQLIHTDDLSSDDEDADGVQNRIGRIPLHWYDGYDHIGYDPHGKKVIKQTSGSGDLIDRALQNEDDIQNRRFVVHDALNAKDVQLTTRQLELIRRIQAGAFAHPEHDANPDHIPYYSGVDPFKSGINSNRYEPKARFQPSKFEKRQVRQLLHRLEKGDITMEYLTGEVRDMNDVKRKNKTDGEGQDGPFLLWKGDEEDELHNRKGPQHIAAPKLPPPTHAHSYNPPEEYLPTEEEKTAWEDMDVHDRPHGLLVPKKFPNLRSVGAYEHAVRERFERCLDLYLCPRVMKRRLNIDPESLVPRLPSANDLRPFPTERCVEYQTPCEEGEEKPMIRCLTVSPDGQFLASGATDGWVRMWEVQTGRLLVSWDISALAKGPEKHKPTDQNEDDTPSPTTTTTTTTTRKPIVSLEWNPNPRHHCLLASAGRTAVIIATGTGGPSDAEQTDALLSSAASCTTPRPTNVRNERAALAVRWESLPPATAVPISAFGGSYGPVVALHTNKEVASARWHRKGDYFVTVSPKAGAAAVLIHQLNRANSQQPFGKNKGGEVMSACFHPSRPFLFVCTKQQIKVYHLVKQAMVKRLISGCRWISSMDVHVSGDHVICGSLDRRMVWFDLDLSSTPYKTLKYHEKALRGVSFHPRYPLMASSSDDGCVHIFHSTVYSDLMRNPLIVPVKILKGHHGIVKKLGVLTIAFHPTQPWLFSGGADGKIMLYQDI